MKINKLLLGTGIAVAVASTISLAAFAWHPKGVITKKVQNVTAGSQLSEADNVNSAVVAKPGDTLKYVIEVRNDAAPADKNYNDMAKTVMTDTLPAGIELVSNPSQRTITENIGTLKPGQKVTKEYLVKVTASTDGSITNTACFTGDSPVNDNPQKGCNPAVVTVKVPEVPPVTPEEPEVPEAPVTPETPETPQAPAPTPEMPAELPKTGGGTNLALVTILLGTTVYAAYRFLQSKRDLESAQLNR
ncbi:hypothetical protein PV379_01710 [Streptomyces caniscabiei]|uniref:hypothetical protein n=1 Tax=Streptomyces caniscabiei TaxID=2746961 RepID=UPI0029B93B37|nr:hypothetical protein [Streptomyces caniscabiei]MDX2776070.1 hypothetical protein [Streptomyces caniscabiei]